MTVIAKNFCIDLGRIKGNKYSFSSIDDFHIKELGSCYNDGEVDFDRNFKKMQINKALRSIGEQYSEIIELRFFQELSYAEIALKTGLPINTVGILISRAIKQLGSKLNSISI